MRILFLADLHGNLPATLAMEKQLELLKPDDVYFLGDAVGKGPDNAATCDWVRAHCRHFVGGNWDYGIGGREYEGDHYYWDQLGEERMQWLNGLPREDEVTVSGRCFRLFHGRPVTELMHAHTDSAQLGASFSNGEKTFDGVIFADCHRPFIRTLHEGYIINTGSVGNSIGVPMAHALLLEGGETSDDPLLMTILSVPYDNQAAAERARQDGHLPHCDSYITEVTTGVYSR